MSAGEAERVDVVLVSGRELRLADHAVQSVHAARRGATQRLHPPTENGTLRQD